MALFKISKGNSSNLPANKVDGYCYVTVDDHKFYVDYTKDDGTLDRFALNAVYADTAGVAQKLGTTDVGNSSKPIYLEGGTPKECVGFLPLTGGDITGELRVDYMRPNNNNEISVYSSLYAANLPSTILTATLTTADGATYYIVNDTNDTQTLTAGKIIIIRPDSTPADKSQVYINYNNFGYKQAYDNKNNSLTYSKCRAEYVLCLRYDGNAWRALFTPEGRWPLNIDKTTSSSNYYLVGHTSTKDVNTNTCYSCNSIYFTPSSGSITATTFDGELQGNAATATKASQDDEGNVISFTYLPLTAGQDKKLIGPLGLTENVNYGASLPDNGFVGQLFFLEDNEDDILPISNGGTGATTAADARIKLGAVNMVTKTITLSTSNWSSNTQTVNVAGVTSSNTILVGYSPESYEAYSDAAIRCVGQNNNTLTFSCESKPSVNVSVNVVILN